MKTKSDFADFLLKYTGEAKLISTLIIDVDNTNLVFYGIFEEIGVWIVFILYPFSNLMMKNFDVRKLYLDKL